MILFLDACIIIYWIELSEPQHQKLVHKLKGFRDRYDSISFAVSALSLLECQVKPVREKNEKLLLEYRQFFSASDLTIHPLSYSVIKKATELRANFNLATPDALQAASALSIEDEIIFFTNDSVFKKVPDLTVALM